ncbi:ABC transporter substrate-binding protein [Paenibacillus puerhi]|uniref:ABC transporter substrate-binding protein n=1 Tax=Paenibacillus puerhi TaxID=2692622 RepID=UPI001357CBBC|nr:extracellular solute-binding protein [Paenibacillus puerhi]
MHHWKKLSMFAISSMLLLTTACGGEGAPGSTIASENSGPPTPKSDPVTLKIYTAQGPYVNEDTFDKDIGRFIKAKFPHVTIEHVHKGKGQEYTDLIAAGNIPDIIYETTSWAERNIITNDLHYDLSGLIKHYNFDMGRLNPAVIEDVKNSNQDNKIYGIPFNTGSFLLFYNKSIFDRFGVPYPKDGMTYDEVYELAKKLSKTDNGVVYKGFQAHTGIMAGFNQLSLSNMSATEDKPTLNTEPWRKLVENYARFFQLENNPYTFIDEFPKGEMAMALHTTEKIVHWYNANTALDFDAVTTPTFKEAPGTGFMPNSQSFFITSQSKYKEQAFEVIAHLLSDEVQTELSKSGWITPLLKQEVREKYGQDYPHLKGMNTKAIFALKNASPPPARKSGLVIHNPNMTRVFDLILKEQKDVVTALRTVEEESIQKINELKAAKK